MDRNMNANGDASCSAENLLSSDDHQVQRQRSQAHLSVLGRPARGTQERIEQPLNHRKECLDLPALSIESLGPGAINHAAEESCFGSLAVIARPATQRWNDSQNSKLLAKEPMVRNVTAAGCHGSRL